MEDRVHGSGEVMPDGWFRMEDSKLEVPGRYKETWCIVLDVLDVHVYQIGENVWEWSVGWQDSQYDAGNRHTLAEACQRGVERAHEIMVKYNGRPNRACYTSELWD